MNKSYLKKPFVKHLKETLVRKKEEDTKIVDTKTDTKFIFNLLGSNIRTLRKMRGFTISKLAEESKLSYVYLQSIEKGKRNICMITVNNIAKALCVSARVLLLSNIDPYRISKLFEVGCKLKRYSHKQLIHMEQLIENIDHIISLENSAGPKNRKSEVV